jgi:hypothetical protein
VQIGLTFLFLVGKAANKKECAGHFAATMNGNIAGSLHHELPFPSQQKDFG